MQPRNPGTYPFFFSLIQQHLTFDSQWEIWNLKSRYKTNYKRVLQSLIWYNLRYTYAQHNFKLDKLIYTCAFNLWSCTNPIVGLGCDTYLSICFDWMRESMKVYYGSKNPCIVHLHRFPTRKEIIFSSYLEKFLSFNNYSWFISIFFLRIKCY